MQTSRNRPLDSADSVRPSSAVNRNRDDIVRRTTLIVPTHVERFVNRARSAGADAVMLDLEDGVAPSAKELARSQLKQSVASLRASVRTILIRVNNDAPNHRIEDMLAALEARPDGLFIPKIETAEELAQCESILTTKEVELKLLPGTFELAVTLETPKAVLNYRAICEAASSRVKTLAVGSEDIVLELGIVATEEGTERLFANSLIVLAAASYCMQPLGLLGDLSNFKDLNLLEAAARRSFAFGFMGSYCINPVQVPILNRGFSPTEGEIAFAREVIAAASASAGQAQHVDRKMVAASAFRRAERLCRRLDTIAAHESGAWRAA